MSDLEPIVIDGVSHPTWKGVLSEDKEVNPTISLKKIDTSSNFSGTTLFPWTRSRATDLKINLKDKVCSRAKKQTVKLLFLVVNALSYT